MNDTKTAWSKNILYLLNGNKEIFCLLILFFLSVIVRYFMSDFIKALATYPDELRYYGIARSIYQGDGVLIRNVATDFQKILYSLFLVPLFSINDSILRIKVISLLNSILMNSSFFPAWFIAKECDIGRNNRIWLLVILFIWPDFLATMTFMSEVLYWPLFLWGTYFLVLNYRKQSYVIAITGGVVCYLGYMCKEIFLVLVFTHIICECIWPVFNCRMNRYSFKNTWQSYKKDLELVSIFGLSFLLCHIIIKTFLFYGLGNSYNSMGLDAILSPYQFMYLIYGFIYFIAAELLVCMFLPVIMPVVCWESLSTNERKFCFLVFILLLISAIVISYTITVREDLGRLVPRVHLRYVGPVVVLSYISMFASLKNYELNIQHSNKDKFTFTILSIIATLLVVVTFKGITPGSLVDQFSGMWYLAIQQKVGVLNITQSDNMPIMLYAVFIGSFLLFLCGINVFLFYREKKKCLKCLFIIIIILTSLVSTAKGYVFVRNGHKAENKVINVVDRIEDYFLTLGKNKVKVFIVDNPGWQSAKYIDTFFDTMVGTYIIKKQDIKSMMMSGESFRVFDFAMYEPIWRNPYAKTDHIDYLIIQKGLRLPFLNFDNLELIRDISQRDFLVYENLNPKAIKFKESSNFQIDFTGDDYNATDYVLSGISGKETWGSWTDGDVLKVQVPTHNAKDKVYRTKISFVGTFNGKQQLIVNDNHNNQILHKSFVGKGDADFTVRSENGFISFAVVFPDAQYANQVHPQSSDHRKLAFQLKKITFQKTDDEKSSRLLEK